MRWIEGHVKKWSLRCMDIRWDCFGKSSGVGALDENDCFLVHSIGITVSGVQGKAGRGKC